MPRNWNRQLRGGEITVKLSYLEAEVLNGILAEARVRAKQRLELAPSYLLTKTKQRRLRAEIRVWKKFAKVLVQYRTAEVLSLARDGSGNAGNQG